MKRFVIATASALFLLAGTATASVPDGSASRSARLNAFSPSANGGPGVETMPAGLAPLVPGVDPGVVADPDVAAPGVPGTAPLLGAVDPVVGAVDPALAALAGALPEPVAGALSPVAEPPAPIPPAPVPEVTPGPEPSKKSNTPPPARKQAASTKRPARQAALQAAAGDLFPGLPANGHAAYGTGSVIHTHVLEVGDQRLENLDAAFSGATFSSAPIPEIKNEMARIVAPALAAGNGFARASGLEVGLAINKSGPNQIIPGSVAEAKAPPSTEVVAKEAGPVNVAPLLSASLLRGEAQSVANAACTTGIDLTWGKGYAADLGLINGGLGSPTLSTAADPNQRSVSWSHSRTFLVPQEGTASPARKFGIASETRQTIAPVTLFKGQPQEFTLEFAGEWVLRTVADGKNTVKIHYGPGEVSPSTPLLRILRPNQPVQEILSTQGLFGPDGLVVDVSPVIKITIGAPPRMIGGADNSKPVETPTRVAAAVDVVRVQLLAQEGLTAADVRIGHMENAAAVPEGGIECRMGLVKNTDKDVVGPGDSFTWTVTVTNPADNDCVITNLKVVDTITATPGIKWSVTGSTPAANQQSDTGLTWNDVGPLNPGQSKELKIHVKVLPDTGPGKFLDEAIATGTCGPAAGTAGAEAATGVPLEARVSLNLPEVNVALGANLLPRELPRTGGLLAVLPALALTGGGLLLRQSKRRKR